MSTDLPKVQVTNTREECINTLLENKTRYLLAFDGEQKFAGVITIHDLLRQILADKEDHFNNEALKQLIDYDESGQIY
jgi:CBS domain containing-hemolysin-like protein